MIFKTWYDILSDKDSGAFMCPVFSSIITWAIWLCIVSTYLHFDYREQSLMVIGGLAIGTAITIFIGYIWFNLADVRREGKSTIFGIILEFSCFIIFSIITGLYITIPLYLTYLIGKFIFYIIPKWIVKLATKTEPVHKTDKPHDWVYNKFTHSYDIHYLNKDELFNHNITNLINDFHKEIK